MMLPLLALFLTQKEHLPTSEAALLVVALTVSEQGPMFLTGAIADRFERQRIISIGFIFGAVGYFLLSLSNPIVLLAISVMLIGFGNALIMPSCKAVVSEYARHIGKQAFTLRTTATNVGGALGPIIGALTYGSFRMALTAISVVYVLVALIVIRADLPSVSADRRSLPLARRLRIALTDRRAVRLTGGSLGYWVCYAQFSFAIPLYTASRLSWDGGVALLFTANSVTIILL